MSKFPLRYENKLPNCVISSQIQNFFIIDNLSCEFMFYEVFNIL